MHYALFADCLESSCKLRDLGPFKTFFDKWRMKSNSALQNSCFFAGVASPAWVDNGWARKFSTVDGVHTSDSGEGHAPLKFD